MGIFTKKTQTDDSQPAEAKKEVAKEKATEAKVETSMKDLYAEGGKSEKTAVKGAAKVNGQAYRILVRPLVTEKAANMGVQDKYAFAVSGSANKIEVAKAIFEVYGVKPKAVNIINLMGKRVRYGKTAGRRSDWKKAIVTLPKGKTIKVYEGV